MARRVFSFVLCVGLALGCGDTTTAPQAETTVAGELSVTIEQPEDGQWVAGAVMLRGVVTPAQEGWTAVWESSVSGVLHEGVTDAEGVAELEKSYVEPGPHTITLTVTTADGREVSDEVQITSLGTVPQPIVQISPTAPTTVDSLKAIATLTADFGVLYAWTKDGAVTTEDGQTVDASKTAKGETWSVSVVQTWGDQQGEAATAEIVVLNTPPTAPVIAIDPAAGDLATLFTCVVTEASFDADGDTTATAIGITVNGHLNDGAGVGPTSAATLVREDGTAASHGDIIQCTATATDGETAGPNGFSDMVVLTPTTEDIFGSDVGFDGEIDGDTGAKVFDADADGTANFGPFEGVQVTGKVSKGGDGDPITWCLETVQPVNVDLPLLQLLDVDLNVCQDENGDVISELVGLVVIEGEQAAVMGTLTVGLDWTMALSIDAIGLFDAQVTQLAVDYAKADTALTVSFDVHGHGAPLAVTGAFTPEADFELDAEVIQGAEWAPPPWVLVTDATGIFTRLDGAVGADMTVVGEGALGPFDLTLTGDLQASGGLISGCLTGTDENGAGVPPGVDLLGLGVMKAAAVDVSGCLVDQEVVVDSAQMNLTVLGQVYEGVEATSFATSPAPYVVAGVGALPDGTAQGEAGTFVLPNGAIMLANGNLQPPAGFNAAAGVELLPDGAFIDADGLVLTEGVFIDATGKTFSLADGSVTLASGVVHSFDGPWLLPEGAALAGGETTMPLGTWEIPAGSVLLPGQSVYIDATGQIRTPLGELSEAGDGFDPFAQGVAIPDGAFLMPNGSVVLADYSFMAPAGFSVDGPVYTSADGVSWDPSTGAFIDADGVTTLIDAGQALADGTLVPPPQILVKHSGWSLQFNVAVLGLTDDLTETGAELTVAEAGVFAQLYGDMSLNTGSSALPVTTSGAVLATGDVTMQLGLLAEQTWVPLPEQTDLGFGTVHGALTHSAGQSAADLVARNTPAQVPPPQIIGGLEIGAASGAASLAEGDWTVEVTAPVDTSLNEGLVSVAGAFNITADAFGFAGKLAALGGQVAVNAGLTSTAGAISAYQLTGGTDFNVPGAEGTVLLTDGALTYDYKADDDITITADGTLTALGLAFDLATEIIGDGGFLFEGAPQTGLLKGLPATGITAEIDGYGAVITGTVTVAEDVFDGEIKGSWASDEDFELEGAAEVDYGVDVALETKVKIAPDGGHLDVGINVAGDKPMPVSGLLSGELTYADGAFVYDVSGDVDASLGGLELIDAVGSLSPGAGLVFSGTADVGFSEPVVSAKAEQDGDALVFSGDIEATLKSGAVEIEGSVSLDADGLDLNDVELTALGGTASIAEASLPLADGAVQDFSLGGDAALAPGPADSPHPLDDGTLNLHYDGKGETEVTAAGTLDALEFEFELSTDIADDGSYLFAGEPQAGDLSGLPATDVTAALSEDGVVMSGQLPEDDLFDGAISGPYNSDSDFSLSGTTDSDYNPDIALDTTVSVGPNGGELQVALNPDEPAAEIAGTASGDLSYDEEYQYHLTGPADLHPAELELDDAAVVVDSETGIAASGLADVGVGTPEVVAEFEPGIAGYEFAGDFAQELNGSVEAAGSVVIGESIELVEPTLSGLGGAADVASQTLTASEGEIEPYTLFGLTDLEVGPDGDHPLTGGGLEVKVLGGDADPHVSAAGKMDVGGQPSAMLQAVVSEAGDYAFSGPTNLPLDLAKLGAGAATISNSKAAQFAGQLTQAPFDSDNFEINIEPTGDMQITVKVDIGKPVLSIKGSMTYTYCATTGPQYCSKLGTTFVGDATFNLVGLVNLEMQASAVSNLAGELIATIKGQGDITLPGGFTLTSGSWLYEDDEVCFYGDFLGNENVGTCLPAKGDFTFKAAPPKLWLTIAQTCLPFIGCTGPHTCTVEGDVTMVSKSGAVTATFCGDGICPSLSLATSGCETVSNDYKVNVCTTFGVPLTNPLDCIQSLQPSL